MDLEQTAGHSTTMPHFTPLHHLHSVFCMWHSQCIRKAGKRKICNNYSGWITWGKRNPTAQKRNPLQLTKLNIRKPQWKRCDFNFDPASVSFQNFFPGVAGVLPSHWDLQVNIFSKINYLSQKITRGERAEPYSTIPGLFHSFIASARQKPCTRQAGLFLWWWGTHLERDKPGSSVCLAEKGTKHSSREAWHSSVYVTEPSMPRGLCMTACDWTASTKIGSALFTGTSWGSVLPIIYVCCDMVTIWYIPQPSHCITLMSQMLWKMMKVTRWKKKEKRKTSSH